MSKTFANSAPFANQDLSQIVPGAADMKRKKEQRREYNADEEKRGGSKLRFWKRS